MQVNVNQNPNMGQGGQPMGGGQMHHQQMYGRSSRGPWVMLVIVVIIVLAVLGFLFRDKLSGKSSENLSGYQAVFLTNGQVYFGKVSHVDSDYVQLTDIFYLQVNQPLQSGQNTQQQQQQQQPQLSLVKLGNELHGPADEMYINHSQILFYEDLKNDGKVAQAIASYKANPNAAAPAPAPSQAPAPAPAAPAPATGK